jgi:LPXTG-site transpeptidase (sortase) family protein
MYRRRLPVYNRGRRSSISSVILVGVILGLAFLLLNRWQMPTPSAPSPTATPQPTDAAVVLAPSAQPLPTGTVEVQARLLIPNAGVNVAVVDTYLNGESWDVAQLGNNAGHLQGTAWIGKPGNIALAGHVELADGSAGIFAHLEQLAKGDDVILALGSAEQRYVVSEVKRVAPNDMTVLYPSPTDEITLITCNAYDFLQNDYQQRVVVVAERVT